ncbi:uncharacterized protein FYW61_018166 [Anableps anableps]
MTFDTYSPNNNSSNFYTNNTINICINHRDSSNFNTNNTINICINHRDSSDFNTNNTINICINHRYSSDFNTSNTINICINHRDSSDFNTNNTINICGTSVSPATGSSPTNDPNTPSTAPVPSASQAPTTTKPTEPPNTLLIVASVCIILGILLIAMLIALPLVAKKFKKKSSKTKEEDIGKPYQSHSIAKAPLSYSNSNGYSASIKEPANSLGNSGAPRIPRATANNNWDSKTNLEMTPSNSRQDLIPSGRNSRFIDNQDDMFSFPQSRPKNNPYDEVQFKSNHYAQNRVTSPYDQVRGQTNPYYN